MEAEAHLDTIYFAGDAEFEVPVQTQAGSNTFGCFQARAPGDDVPVKWRHIRSSSNMIKAEFNTAADKLISVYHCSKTQAVAGIIVCANKLFDDHGSSTMTTLM